MSRVIYYFIFALCIEALQSPPKTSLPAELIEDHAYRIEPDEMFCDAPALAAARQAIQNGDDSEEENPCLRDSRAKGNDGLEDPADDREFIAEDGEELLETEERTTMMPKVILLAIPHSGSTSLADQLDMHPELSYGKMKEHNMIWKISGKHSGQLKEIYKDQFPVDTSPVSNVSVKYTFDASPATLFLGIEDDLEMARSQIGKDHGTGVFAVQQVKDILGADTKFIVVLRNPLYWQYSLMKSVKQFEDMVSPNNTLGKRSCYADAIMNWLKVFPRQNFQFHTSEEYFENPASTLRDIQQFLNVEQKIYSETELQAQGRRRSTFNPSKKIEHMFWEDGHMNECKHRLGRLTGRAYDWN